ncbi:beta-lactamase family protein [Ochrobactrum sp. Q0168]|uniref:serine hydrolase domain-containing protein n=1 Tax=Ochrobactrum sp. Q0168 TaxID=2793241 RepID=UPI0018EC906B|nr:beta-lactamase family protein [Ochrobactrum sp. Q0168]
MSTPVIAAVIAAATTALAEPTTDPALEARLNPVIDRALSEKRIVGTVVLVAKDGRLVYHRAAGYADREAGREMREDAIFRLASITKPIVTAAAMRLVEEGRLDLEAPVTRWLPYFRPAMPDGSTPEITIRQLLNHTSGLGYGFLEPVDGSYHKLNISDGLDQPGLPLEENLARLSAAPLNFIPGTSWRYSLGIDVLGGVLEKIEERSLSEIVRDKITAPLGIYDTDFSVRDTLRLTKAYADGKPEPVPMTDGIAVSFMGSEATFAPSRILNARSYQSGGAGMAGTASDVLHFLEAIRTGGAPVLKSETVETMIRDQVGSEAETQGPGWGFGYGWAVLNNAKQAGTPQAVGTLQWGGAYGHYWFVDRKNGLSVVALTNTAFEGMAGAFPTDIRNAVYE